ncbi:MAG: hypothetical protein U0271_36740 [Polyangiaceae bacterium]
MDEVATFVRATMGERDRKRRASIRDAALRMDEQAMHPVALPSTPAAHESVSGVMLTKTQTPTGSLSSADITHAAGAVTQAAPSTNAPPKIIVPALPLAPALPERAEPTTPTSPPLPSSPTLVAMESSANGAAYGASDLGGAPSRRTKAVAVTMAIVGGIAVGALLVAKLGGSSQQSAANEKSRPTSTVVATTNAPVSTASATAERAGTSIDLSALPDNTASSPSGSTEPVADATTASTATTTSTFGRPFPTTTTRPTTTTTTTTTVAANPTTTSPATATTPPTTAKPTSNGTVPAVQDPGF